MCLQSRHIRTGFQSGGRVCSPLKPDRQEVRAKTHVSSQAAIPKTGRLGMAAYYYYYYYYEYYH